MLALEWISLLTGCVQYIQGVHMFIFIANSSLMRSFLLVFAACSDVSVFDCQHVSETHLQQTFSKELFSRRRCFQQTFRRIAGHPL